MLIKISELCSNFNINPSGVVHVGAHLAEEAGDYAKYGWGKILWVESQKEKAVHIRNLLDSKTNLIIEATVWSESGIRMNFNIASNGESSSILEFGSHSKNYPNITYTKKIPVVTQRLDEIIPENFHGNFLNLDIQGAELEALKGLGRRLSDFNWIYSEVNKEEVYKNCATVDKIDEYLNNYGYTRVATRWILGAGWGDALYAKENLTKLGFLHKIRQKTNNVAFYGIQAARMLKRILLNE